LNSDRLKNLKVQKGVIVQKNVLLYLKYLTHKNLAEIFNIENRMKEAIINFQEALKIEESDSDLWYNLATVCFEANQFPLCRLSLEKSLQMNPKNIFSLKLMVEFLYIIGDKVNCNKYNGILSEAQPNSDFCLKIFNLLNSFTPNLDYQNELFETKQKDIEKQYEENKNEYFKNKKKVFMTHHTKINLEQASFEDLLELLLKYEKKKRGNMEYQLNIMEGFKRSHTFITEKLENLKNPKISVISEPNLMNKDQIQIKSKKPLKNIPEGKMQLNQLPNFNNFQNIDQNNFENKMKTFVEINKLPTKIVEVNQLIPKIVEINNTEMKNTEMNENSITNLTNDLSNFSNLDELTRSSMQSELSNMESSMSNIETKKRKRARVFDIYEEEKRS
jgi:hypothetical protein